MKMNCQILKAFDLANLVANRMAENLGYGVLFKAGSCFLTKEGMLHMNIWNKKTSLFDIEVVVPPNSLAYISNMPLWEVVSVDYCGDDELAILFYENN